MLITVEKRGIAVDKRWIIVYFNEWLKPGLPSILAWRLREGEK